MNYYIQGNKANADKIKAAFEAKGYKCEHNCDSMNFLYYTINNHVTTTGIQSHTRQLIMRLAELGDYSELELPVEPKFKKGDWIACDADSFTLSIKSLKDGNYYFHQGASLPIKDIDEHYHLWTIADAKDGDVLVTTKIRSCPFIYRKTDYNNNLAYYYAGIDSNGDFCEGCLKRTLCHFGSVSDVIPATKEQRDLLFAKMKEAGYKWDANKNDLRKIKPHYDISNFKPFQKVLVRQDDSCTWGVSFFSRYDGMFLCCSNVCFTQCIPFDGNEHLLGTTDPCDEQYINW